MSTQVTEHRWENPIREEHHDEDRRWTIEAHDDQPIADGQKYAAEVRVLVLLNGERVREFTYPSYRIWTLLAHWTEGLADLLDLLAPAVPTHTGSEEPRGGVEHG